MNDATRPAPTTPLRDLVARAFRAIESKDLAAALTCFAADAVMIDPHYPEPHMAGRRAIGDGLAWAFATLRTLRFTPLTYCESADGQCAAIETATEHTLPGGRVLRMQQTFMVETEGGAIRRLQAYTPYGPAGVGAVVLELTRLQRWLRRRRR